ncbi:MAG: isoleucine--tRNA ligase [Sphingomonas sp.]|jgi:isoleucyl-tRNA synthetase
MTEETSPQRDYRDTVFLPKTDFPMKAGLPQKEPAIQARWQDMGIYDRLRDRRRGREKFILHDGPPYANGDMHIGHALNHILKDMVCRTRNLMGYDAPYVPGWDCHGLPIEWKVEEEYRKKKLNKDEVPVEEFRAQCRAYARKWVDTQREQLKRLGIMADWDHPYLTMDFEAEATIVSELMKFAESDQLYRGAKPVMWSPVEKTALAEAEVEYEDITSTQIDVAFEIVEAPNAPELQALIDAGEKVHAVIWTTTPWTIPVNQALAYGGGIEYVTVWSRFGRGEWAGRKFVVAKELLGSFVNRLDRTIKSGFATKFPDESVPEVVFENTPSFNGSQLAGATARHPMHHLGGFFAEPRPFLPGDFVTTDAGTGLVHMAPDHGEDDFELCKAHGINPVFAVEGDGKYRADWPWLGGQGSVINNKFVGADGPICSDLRAAGGLLAASDDFKHSYPHSWRSKAKVIFRCTPQWFVPMDKPLSKPLPFRGGDGGGALPDGTVPAELPHPSSSLEDGGLVMGHGEGIPDTLRNRALQAIADTRFYPEKGRNRIGAMVEGRPDWVLSRQRAWGVPITLFVNRKTGAYLKDADVNARIIAAVREAGVDAWSDARAQEYLGDAYSADDFERVSDILDVWFDSGCTHAFVLESGRWPDLQWPANLYLEGSDQHRGWFQSSLLESCGTRGRAPYDAVLTHGFTMDSKGMKMSKSLGNTVNPLDLMKEYGADILRLWALSVDFTEDHRIGKEILAGVADQYRKLRNTFRYMLGALDGFGEAERIAAADMPELERYMLHLLAELDAKLREAAEGYDFNRYVRLLSDFANEDLSAFYFDIRKDSLYCDAPDSVKRRACRTVMDMLFHALVRYAAPVTVFTAEEIWQSRFPDEGASVHFLEWPELTAVEADAATWEAVRGLRVQVNEAIEPLRREKIVRSSLEADVTVPAMPLPADELAEAFIVASVALGDGLTVKRTDHHKCGRCWRLLPEVSEDGALCDRCAGVVGA